MGGQLYSNTSPLSVPWTKVVKMFSDTVQPLESKVPTGVIGEDGLDFLQVKFHIDYTSSINNMSNITL